jgi:hypothetical protein
MNEHSNSQQLEKMLLTESHMRHFVQKQNPSMLAW